MINKTLIEEVKYITKLMGISEEKCYLITENAKNNNMKLARRYLEEKLGWDNEQIMDFFGNSHEFCYIFYFFNKCFIYH